MVSCAPILGSPSVKFTSASKMDPGLRACFGILGSSAGQVRWVAHVPNIAGGSSARSPGQKSRDRSSMQEKESMKEAAEEHDDT